MIIQMIFAAILGASLASFANVLIYRLSRDISLVVPATSFCPSCQVSIHWYDKVPVISWFVLNGQCRSCGADISVRYVIVEVLGALLGALVCLDYGFNLGGLSILLLLINLLVIAIIDWKYRIIPHALTVSGLVIGLALSQFNNTGLKEAIVGALVGVGIVLVLSYGYRFCRGQHGMGGGDLMLLAMLGSYWGPLGVLVILFVACIIGLLYMSLVCRLQIKGDDRISFGPFLSLAAALVLML
ncbi:prepilin peptidase [bacterium]|nr:prepilin peptidase [bacterium]